MAALKWNEATFFNVQPVSGCFVAIIARRNISHNFKFTQVQIIADEQCANGRDAQQRPIKTHNNKHIRAHIPPRAHFFSTCIKDLMVISHSSERFFSQAFYPCEECESFTFFGVMYYRCIVATALLLFMHQHFTEIANNAPAQKWEKCAIIKKTHVNNTGKKGEIKKKTTNKSAQSDTGEENAMRNKYEAQRAVLFLWLRVLIIKISR